jgi:hypothetical protein
MREGVGSAGQCVEPFSSTRTYGDDSLKRRREEGGDPDAHTRRDQGTLYPRPRMGVQHDDQECDAGSHRGTRLGKHH